MGKKRERALLSAVFRRVGAPRRVARLAINRDAVWYTWSAAARDLFERVARASRTVRRAPLQEVRGIDDYPYTYSLSLTLLSPDMRRELGSCARALQRLPSPRKIWLLTDILGGALDGRALHRAFAFLRAALAKVAGSAQRGLYVPLPQSTPAERGFPLHSDLWAPELLMNVFEKVAGNRGGASVFLRVSELRSMLSALEQAPASVRRDVNRCFATPHENGRFDTLYDLLHGEYPWVPALRAMLKRRQRRILLEPGQGYLIHDRTWLHGREPVLGPVPRARLHRLVFGPVRTEGGIR